MLKSNGLRLSKNLPAKFGFSPKPIPANIAKKLPPQRCFKPLFIPVFNFSYKWPTFAFTGENEYTLDSPRKIAHSGSHAETRGSVLAADRLDAYLYYAEMGALCGIKCQFTPLDVPA